MMTKIIRFSSHQSQMSTVGSDGRKSLVGKRIVVTMKPVDEMHKPVDKRHKPVDEHDARMQGVGELPKTNTTSSEKQDNKLIIGCSEKIVMPIFW